MKILQKILVVLLIAMCVSIVMPRAVVNADGAIGAIGQIQPTNDTTGTEGFVKVVNNLLGFLQIASGLIAVVMIAVTGFRYIIETPEMKNELKKSMVPIIVGILLVFFATSIAKFFIGIFSSGDGNSGG